MDSQTIDRVVAIASIGLLSALALGTYYLAEVSSRKVLQAPKAAPTEPDFYVTGFALIKVDSSGQPAIKITAKKMTHFPAQDTSEFEEPIATTLNPNQPALTIRANKAVMKEVNTEKPTLLILSENVRIERKATADRPALLVQSEQITVNPDNQTASSALEVKITNGNTVMTALGFELDNAKQQLNLLSSVKGIFNQPAPQ
jgi:lipopolysaccharide export system protein LptC